MGSVRDETLRLLCAFTPSFAWIGRRRKLRRRNCAEDAPAVSRRSSSERSVRVLRRVLGLHQLLLVLVGRHGAETAIVSLSICAGEGERHLIIVVVDRGAGVGADVEGLIPCRISGTVRSIVWVATPSPSTLSMPVPPRPIPLMSLNARVANPSPSYLKSNSSRVLARRQRPRPLPAHPLEVEQVPDEDRLALQQVQTIAAEAPAVGIGSCPRRRPAARRSRP